MGSEDSNPPGSGPNGADRRVFRRHSIHVAGHITFGNNPSVPCIVHDFCPGGMLVSYESGVAPAAGARAVIQCAISLTGETRECRFDARIAHLNPGRAGLEFIEPDLAYLQWLQEYASQSGTVSAAAGAQATAAMGLPGAVDRDQMIRLCGQVVRDALAPLMSRFLALVNEDLFEVAKDSRDVAQQNAVFHTIKLLNDNSAKFKTAFADFVDTRLQRAGQAQDQAPSDEVDWNLESLSLVQEHDFDKWLSVADFMDSAGSEFRELLSALRERLSVLFGYTVEEETNPYGPMLFVESFQQALDQFDLKHSMTLTCHKLFKKAFFAGGKDVYYRLNQVLVDGGILPGLKFRFKAPPPIPSTAPEEPAAPAAPPSADAAAPAVSAATSPNPAVPAQQAPAAPAAAPPAAGQTPSSASAQPAPAARGARVRDLYQLVGDLTDLQSRMASATSSGASPQAGGPVADEQTGHARPSYSTPELLDALSSPAFAESVEAETPSSGGAPDFGNVIETILGRKSADGAPKQIGQHEARVIKVANHVFDSLLRDMQVSKSVQPWIRKLEGPILKMALLDEQLFVDRSHVARQVINQLADLEARAQAGDADEQAGTIQALDALVTFINRDFDGTLKVFHQAVEQLQRLIKAQNEVYRTNIKSVVAECLKTEGQTKAASPRLPAEPDAAAAEDEWLRRVKRLEEGHWILFDATSEEPKRLKVAWIATRTGKYIFVNALGKKDRVLQEQDLVAQLREGTAVLLDGADVPAMDRAQYSMLQKLHEQLLFQSSHDPVTGLINRREFERHLQEAIDDAKAESRRHMLCFVDIDQFKVVNATCGYDAGDRLLQEVAKILQDGLDQVSVLARLGNDQFGMLLCDQPIDDALDLVEGQMADLHDYRFEWNGQRLSVSLSAGLVPIGASSTDAMALLQAAESSCSDAKEKGGDRIQVYHAGHSRRRQEMEWAVRVDKALDEDALQLRCQKIEPIQPDTGLEPHYEILLGLADEFGGQGELGAFIKAAEHHKRMVEVDRWVIRRAFGWIAQHEQELDGIASFSINLSGPSLNDERLIAFIGERVRDTGVPIEKICFEITETAGITNLSDAADFINTIKSIGCKFSLDDFGSGMSSYAYLKNLPVDFLKIDGVFVKDIARNTSDYAVAKSVCEIGHFLGKTVIAEYVQDAAAVSILRDLGVDFVQGFGVEEPKPLESLLRG